MECRAYQPLHVGPHGLQLRRSSLELDARALHEDRLDVSFQRSEQLLETGDLQPFLLSLLKPWWLLQFLWLVRAEQIALLAFWTRLWWQARQRPAQSRSRGASTRSNKVLWASDCIAGCKEAPSRLESSRSKPDSTS